MTDVIVKMTAPQPSPVFDAYWRFAAERQAIYFRRLRGDEILTYDDIISAHRFTNCYRAADRVSQYLIRNVIYQGDQDPPELAFRILLFKIFNKISTWETIARNWRPRWADHAIDHVADVLDTARSRGNSIYSAAYVMPSPGGARCKHRAHLDLIDSIGRRWEHFAEAKSLADLTAKLQEVQSFGPFLAFQYAIDLNYSDIFHFNENDYVAPGPGARDGIRKCFSDLGDYSEADVIRWTCERADYEFDRLGVPFLPLFGRRLHLIDCQNIFCEVDKYARAAHPEATGTSGRTKIKQTYRANPNPIPTPFFPPRWGINYAVRNATETEYPRLPWRLL